MPDTRRLIHNTPPAPPRRSSSFGELIGLLFGPLPGIKVAPLLTDPAPDPGLFGPESVTWRVGREPLVLLGGGRALLLQVAHPLVAQGVVDHSDHATDPMGRLVRTVRWLVAVSFGTRAEALAAIEQVNVIHQRVCGALADENATARHPAGTAYTANDPELARWVHATIVQSMLIAYQTVVGPLQRGDRDALVREWDVVATLMGVAESMLWDDAGQLDDFIETQARAMGSATPASRTAALVVLHPPLPTSLLRPPFAAVGFLTAGMLPETVRRGYRLRWSAAHARSHRAIAASICATQRVLPQRLRVSPVYRMAMNRSAGRGLRMARSRSDQP